MKLFSLPTVLAAALFSVVVSVPFLPFAAPKASLFHFEVTATSSTDGLAQIFFDVGRGFNEADSSKVPLTGGAAPVRLSFALPAGDYRSLRYDPLDRDGTFTLRDALIRDAGGKIARRFDPADFTVAQQIASRKIVGDQLELTTEPLAADPILNVRTEPFALQPTLGENLRFLTRRFGGILLVVLAGVWLAGRSLVRFQRLWVWAGLHPGRAVAICAVFAVVASSYPVIFLGKSIVSPNNGTVLLYEDYPTIPGYRDRITTTVSGADIGAIMWSHIPVSMLQHDALVRDHEWPLWNRYNSAGSVLLGQGQTMFGDPLHLPVVLANGAAWAWDIKYLVAKWLLACGLGLCVFRLTGHLPAALLVAFAADFVGFFPYRVNHPAFFSFCYAPWVLYCWLRIATAPRWTGAARWLGALLLANGTLMNSGTAKEAYMLLLTLNFAGAWVLLLAPLSPRERVLRFALGAWAGVLFLSLAAPVWITFLDALKQAYTSYNAATAYQVQPSLALGFFDEVLLRPFFANEGVYNPSANFFFLTGALAFFVYLRVITAHRIALALALAALVPLAMVFGLVPPLWIVKIPFLGNVAHVDNSFGLGLILITMVLAGAGFATASSRLGRPEGRGDLAVATLLLFALAFPYVAFRQTVQRSTFSYLHWGETLPFSSFVWGSFAVLLAAALTFMFAARRLLRRGADPATLLVMLTCLVVMLWRHGWHAGVGFEGRVITPAVRADFHAPSAAIAALRTDQKEEPSRAVGFQGNFFPGWNDVYRVEGICGPDALMNPSFRELLEACGVVRIWDWRIYVEFPMLAKLRPVFDFLNVRYFLDFKSDRGRLGAALTPVFTGDLDLYRSETAWPRAFFTDRVATYGKAADFAQLLNSEDGRRPFAAMLEDDLGKPAGLQNSLTGRAIIPARNYRLTTNTTAFDIDATSPGVAVLSEAWFPRDFQVTLDGERVHYLRVNHAFKGVVIPSSGRHHVEFTYRPARFTLALTLFGAGLGLLGASVFTLRRIEKGASQLTVTSPSV